MVFNMSIPSESSTIDSVLVVMLINFHLPWKLGDEFKPRLESIVNSFWHDENARIDSTMTREVYNSLISGLDVWLGGI